MSEAVEYGFVGGERVPIEPFDRDGLFAKSSFETRDERRLWRLAIEQRGRADRAQENYGALISAITQTLRGTHKDRYGALLLALENTIAEGLPR